MRDKLTWKLSIGISLQGKNKPIEPTTKYLYHFPVGLTVLFYEILNIYPPFPSYIFNPNLLTSPLALGQFWKQNGLTLIAAPSFTNITKMNECSDCPLTNKRPCYTPDSASLHAWLAVSIYLLFLTV